MSRKIVPAPRFTGAFSSIAYSRVLLRKRENKMKGNIFNEDKDLTLAKEFLDTLLADLNKEERNSLLKELLEATKNI